MAKKKETKAQQNAKSKKAAAVSDMSAGRTTNEFRETTPGVSDVPVSLLPEVTALREEQAASQAETEAVAADAAEQIALQQSIQANVADLAAGELAGITATGPVLLTPEEQFNRAQDVAERQDAFQTIVTAFTEYGIEGIADTVFAIMADSRIGEEQAIYKLKYDTSLNPATNRPWNEAYANRFAANFERIKAGKPALSEGQYLAAERSYAQALRSLGVTRLATRNNFNKFISGDVSVDEVVDRVTLAVERIQNAPAETKAALARFYPNLSVLDVAEAVLDPEVSLPALRRQVAVSEIGGGAIRAGLKLGRERAEELERAGITEQQAQAGFQQIAGGLQRGGQLAAIYQEQPYGQTTAETEVFGLAGAAQAGRQRRRLAQKEEAAFGGQTGLAGGALARDRAGAI